MEFISEFGQFFILGDTIQRAHPFKSFCLKGDIRSIQITGHEAAKGAIAAVPGKDGLSRAAAGAVLGFLVAGPLGTVVGASAGAGAPKGVAGRDATEERFILDFEFYKRPKISNIFQTAYVSRDELSQLAPYLTKPKKVEKQVEKKEIKYDPALNVNSKNGTIERGYETRAVIFNRDLIRNLSNSNVSSTECVTNLIDYIKSPILEYKYDNRLKRIENLYLSMRWINDFEMSKEKLKNSIFSDSHLGGNFSYSDINGGHKVRTDDCNNITNRMHEILKKSMNDKTLDDVLRLHIMPHFLKRPSKFPTNLDIVNVAAITSGSFLERRAMGGWPIDKLKLESARLRNFVGPDKFDKLLCRSVESSHFASHVMLEKIIQKETLSDWNITRSLQCCIDLCFMADRDEVAYAENSATIVLMKARARKRTKKIDEEINRLQEFLEYPKGELSDKLELYRANLKKKPKSSSLKLQKNETKIFKARVQNVKIQKLNPKETKSSIWGKVENIFWKVLGI